MQRNVKLELDGSYRDEALIYQELAQIKILRHMPYEYEVKSLCYIGNKIT